MGSRYGILDAIWDALRGKLKLSSKRLSTDRMAICTACEVRDSKTNICTACGCFLPAKVKLKKSTCPLDRW